MVLELKLDVVMVRVMIHINKFKVGTSYHCSFRGLIVRLDAHQLLNLANHYFRGLILRLSISIESSRDLASPSPLEVDK